MKRTLVLILLVAALIVPAVYAQNVQEDKEIRTLQAPMDGRAKVGLLAGFPSGATFGYRLSNWFELNLTAGYNFTFPQAVVVSTNGLFTVLNIPIGDAGVLPLSVGPQVNFIIGNDFMLETVGDVRLEYTFANLPLNLFVEAGFGVRWFDSGSLIKFAWNGGVGARYVF